MARLLPGEKQRDRIAAAWAAFRGSCDGKSDERDTNARTESGGDGKSDEPDIVLDERKESVAAAMGAAVAHILNRPDSIRQRAQTAATIASAVVAALVVAAIAGLSREQTESWNTSTIVLVVFATVTWILTIGLFLRVVVFAQREAAGKPYPAFVKEYQSYAQVLRERLRLAAWSSTFALLFAVGAVGAEVYELQTSRPRERLLVLSPTATAAVGRLCGRTLPADEVRRGEWTILGEVGTTALARALVPVEVTAIVSAQSSMRRLSCTGGGVQLIRGERGITVRLPKSAVLASSEVQQCQQCRR